MNISQRDLYQLADRMRPVLDRWYAAGSSSQAQVETHALDGSVHTGTLAWTKVSKAGASIADLPSGQLPWGRVDTAGSSIADLTSRDYDLLTDRGHVLASTSGLGADHTVSGLTAGFVLRASGATTAAFAQLQHSDLGGVSADQHHAQVHNIVGADHQLTGAAWTVVGATGVNTLGLLQARSTALATAETLLKTDSVGGVYLQRLGINTDSPARLFHIIDNTGSQMRLGYDASNYMDFLVDNGGSWRVAPTGDIIFDPTGNDVRPLNGYDINLGTPLTKYLALYAAELWVDTLVASEVRSTIGGKVNVSPTTELTRDLAGASLTYDTITQRGTTTSNAGTGGGGGGAIAQRGSATQASTTGTTCSVTKPTGVTTGDVLVAVITWRNGSVTVTPPSGWTQTGSTLNWNIDTFDFFARVYYKVAGGSEPSTYDWGLSSSEQIMVSTIAYSGVDNTTPIDAVSSQMNSDSTSSFSASVTTTFATDQLIYLMACGGTSAGSTTATANGGLTERVDGTNALLVKNYIADEALVSAGATGSRSSTLSAAQLNCAFMVALAPSASGGNTSISVNRPTGTVNGDVLIATTARAGGTLTPPAGWTLVASQAASGANLAVYRRVASSEGSSYTWALDTTDALAVAISTYYNVDTTTPTPTYAAQTNASGTAMVAPTLTPSAGTGMLIFAGAVAGNIRATAPGGMGEDADTGTTGIGVYMADESLASGSATGTRTATLASAAVSAAANIYLLPSSAGGAAPTTIYVKYNNLNNGDRVLLEARGHFEAMAVTSAYTTITAGEEYSYTVTRNLDGTGANDWIAGDALMNTGQTGNGWLELYAQYGLTALGEGSNQRVGPTIVGNVRQSNTWNDFGTRFAAGSLNGLYDYSTSVYGFAAGNPAGTWISLDDTNGLRFMNVLTAVGYIQPNGNWRFNGDGSNYIQWNGTALTVAGSVAITGGSGYANISDRPTSLAAINASEGSKLTGIQAGATVGATWGSNLSSIPIRFADAPSTPGLYMTSSYLGFYNSGWKTYMTDQGYFYLNAGAGSNYLSWNGTTLTISGAINVVGGFTGVNYAGSASAGGAANSISGQGALATQNSVTWSTQVTGTGKPADNATVGAVWGSNLSSIPVRFQDSPSSNGLYLTSSALGYYNGGWKSYFDSSGNFFFGYSASNRIEYNASANQLRGIGGGAVQWYASAANGYMYAAGGAVALTNRGVEILRNTDGYYRALSFVTAIGSGERGASMDLFTTANPILPDYSYSVLSISTFATTGKANHRIEFNTGQLTVNAPTYATSFDAGSVGNSWIAMPYGTGWANYGGGYQAGQYMRFGNIVFLRGLVTLSSGTNANIGNLPSGYRPTSGQVIKGCQASTGLARIDITTAGAINVVGGATTGMWVYLDHIFFTS